MNMKSPKFYLLALIAVLFLGGWFFIRQKPELSVIVPVYNSEKYLARCLDSIFLQSGNFEVIAINDGSTDGSLAILEQYAKKYNNLKVINQENKGVSATRNIGLKAAETKYVTFVDSDDWLEKNAFANAMAVIKKDKSDIVLTGFFDVYDKDWVKSFGGDTSDIPEESKYPDRNLDKLALFSPFHGKEAHSDLYYTGGGVRGRLFKKSFLDKYHINFPEKINSHEDDVFMFRAYLHNPLISVLPIPVYDYHNRSDSISKSVKVLKTIPQSLEVMTDTKEFQNADRRTQMLIQDNWLGLYLLGMANLKRNGAPEGAGAVEAYDAYTAFNRIYNQRETSSCRNYQKIKKYLEAVDFNQPL